MDIVIVIVILIVMHLILPIWVNFLLLCCVIAFIVTFSKGDDL